MFRVTVSAMLIAAAASIAAAQEPGKPLGDLLDTLPLPEDERAAPAVEPEPVAPPSGIGTTELPPSDVAERIGAAPPDSSAVIDAETGAEAAADAEWAAIQERRRQAVNAVEAPLVAKLNQAAAERAEAELRRAEQAEADHARSLAEHEAETRRRAAEHRAALEAHARRVEREQAEYRARVEACLNGVRSACAE